MCKHHSPDQPEFRGQPRRHQCGNSRKNIRAEEDSSERSGIHAETQVEPICGETLDYEPTTERVQREQPRQLKDDSTGRTDAEPAFCACPSDAWMSLRAF